MATATGTTAGTGTGTSSSSSSSSIKTNVQYLLFGPPDSGSGSGGPSSSDRARDPTSTSGPKSASASASATAATTSATKLARQALLGADDTPSRAVPASWRTRSALATARYVVRYVFWRLVRYGKVLALGAVTAAIGGTFLGTLASGASIFVAPTATMGLVLAGGLAVAKFGWRHRPASIRHLESRILSTLDFAPSRQTGVAVPSAAAGSERESVADRMRRRARHGSDPRADEERDAA